MHLRQQDPSLQEPVKLEPARAVLGYLKRAAGEVNIAHLLLVLFALHLFALSFPSDTSNGEGGSSMRRSMFPPLRTSFMVSLRIWSTPSSVRSGVRSELVFSGTTSSDGESSTL